MRRARCDRGVVGFELLPFLVLVFVFGILLFAQAWAVIDAKLATSAGAREAARTFVETPADFGDAAAVSAALEAGHRASESHGRPTAVVRLLDGGSLERCARVTFEATEVIPILRIPLVGGAGSMTVRSTHSEIVDPYRDGLATGAGCAL